MWGGIDNISLIYPKFDTNIRASGKDIDNRSGSFKDVMFDMSRMATGFEINTYCVYPYFPNQFIHFENKAAKNKKNVLFFSDSFGMVCALFLSLDMESVFFGYGAYNDLIDTLDNNKPDIVVLLLSGDLIYHLSHLSTLMDTLKDQGNVERGL
jgi:hypothetical protein